MVEVTRGETMEIITENIVAILVNAADPARKRRLSAAPDAPQLVSRARNIHGRSNYMLSAVAILHACILIVDDLESDCLLLEQVLRKAGYTCITTTNDPFAVSALHRKNHYDLILLDLCMPGMDGFQVMEGLNEIETGGYLPVLALTAEPHHKVRALQCGAKDFVSKPFELEEVLMRVHNMLEVRLLHAAAQSYGKMLETQVFNDPLTGLANRRSLTDRMSMALDHACCNRSAMAVVYLDLDGFKQINDTLGHGVGDDLLKLVAERLEGMVREDDTVARLGGDEFIIVLRHVSGIEYAVAVASRAIQAVAKPYEIGGATVTITISAGVSIYPDHGDNVEKLIKSADRALYEAKRSGKNVYRIADVANPAVPAPLLASIGTCVSDRTRRQVER